MQRSTIILIILLLLLSILPDSVAAQEQPRSYEGPDGGYTVPIPQGWEVTEQEDYVTLTGPEAEVTVYLLTVPLQQTVENTISQAWSTVNPDFDLEPQLSEPPAPAGIDRRVVISYQAEDRFRQAVGSLVEDQVFVILIEGSLTAVQTRQAQLRVITEGFSITGIEEQDLSDVEPVQLTGAMLDQIEQYISDLRNQFQIPGASVAIVQEGQVIYTGGFGLLEAGGDEPVTPTTRMMIGSTGKSMTTAMMASMVDEGLFNWDTPVVEVLPGVQFANPELTDQITMRNLVCACSGVPRRDLVLIFQAERLAAEDVVESLAAFELLTDFGETFQYSNQMIATGGYAAAAAAEAEFGNLYEGYLDAMQTRMFDPIGMPNTSFYFGGIQDRSHYASPHSLNFGYSYEPSPAKRAEVWQPVAPAAGPWSTAEDMGRYLLFQMQNGVGPDGERIVSEENLLETREARVAVSSDVSYGLGWFIDDYEGIRLIQHGGNVIGFTSVFGFLPEKELGVVVLTNAEQANAFGQQVRDYVFDLAFDNYDEARDREEIEFALQQLREQVQPPEGLQQRVEPERVRTYTGLYAHDLLGEATVYLKDNQLMMDTGFFQLELWPITSAGTIDQFLLTELKFPVKFHQTDAGAMEMTVGRGTQAYTFSRQQEIPAPVERALAALSQGVRENVTFADLAGLEWIPRQFANASLGCPRPDRSYAEVVTPGYQVWLTYAGTTYDYRVAEDGEQVILCDTRPAVPTEPSPPQEQPAAPCGDQYVVEENDTLFQIAQQCNTTVTALLRANPAITDPARIFPGQTLTLPDGGQPRSVSIQPDSGPPGTTIQVFASGFPPGAHVEVGLGPPASEYVVVGTREIGADGELMTSLQISPDTQPPEKRVAVVVLNNEETVSEVFTVTDGQPTPAPTPTQPANNLFEQAQIYLVALGDAGRSGQAVGCDDSLVPVTVTFEPTQAPLTAALQELFAIASRTYGQSGLYNAFYQSDLAVEGIDIENGEAIINLSGTLRPGGVCDEPRMEGQIKQTALQFDTIDEVSVFLNGSPLSEAF